MRRVLTSFIALTVLASGAARAGENEEKEMKALLEKAVKAHGGAKNLEKYPGVTHKMKGEIVIMNAAVEFTGVVVLQLPDQARSEIELTLGGTEIKQITVFNKDKGWIAVAGTKMKLTKDMIKEAKEDMHAGRTTTLVPLRDQAYKLSPLGELKINDADSVGVLVARKGFRDVNLYFDKKTHLLRKMERRAKDPMSGEEVSKETFYHDYKDVQGMQHPYKVVLKVDGKDFMKAELSDVKFEEKVDASNFDEP